MDKPIDPSRPSSRTAGPAPGETPRQITQRGRHRSWAEPRVRAWWLLALLTLAAILVSATETSLEWYRQWKLFNDGQAVWGQIIGPSKDTSPRQRITKPNELILFRYEYNGKTYFERHTPPHRNDGYYETGDKLTIHVDPADPRRFTPEAEVRPLLPNLIATFVLLPFVIGLGTTAIVLRWRILRLWASGTAMEAVVTACRQSASSPRSRLCICALANQANPTADVVRSERIPLRVAIPYAAGIPAPGDLLWLIVAPRLTRDVLVAKLYE